MNFKFDEKTHTYTVDGLVIPSVTQIISDMGLSNVNLDDPAVIQAGQFGTAVHKGCELLDLHLLDVGTVDDSMWPYIDAWKKCKKDLDMEILHIEVRLYHSQYLFAGTLDRIVVIDDKLYVLDIKTSAAFPPTLGLQTSAYEALYSSNNGIKRGIRRLGVKLAGDGTYKLEHLNNKLDWNIFLSAMSLYRWKLNNLK